MDTISQSSIQSTYSTRAHNLLEQIRTQTSSDLHREFLATLKLFKRKQIDSDTVQERVQNILKNHPHLLAQFEECLSSKPQPVPYLSRALTFVNKVKEEYADSPLVYEQFSTILRDFQRGIYSKEDVKASIAILLSKTPALVDEFGVFYCGESKMIRGDSNDTLAEATSDTQLLQNPGQVESQTRNLVTAPKSRKLVFIAVGLSLIIVVGATFAVLYYFRYLDVFFNGTI